MTILKFRKIPIVIKPSGQRFRNVYLIKNNEELKSEKEN